MKVSKVSIAMDAFTCFLFTTAAVLNAIQDKWVMTDILSLIALFWVVLGIFDYKTFKLQG